MRPAVCASVMRNRKTVARRVHKAPHTFSWSRFFLMLFVGGALLIVGMVVTILGIENAEKIEELPGDKVLYKFFGLASLAFGTGLVLASGLYYCCWGVQRPVSSKHAKHRKKAREKNEKYDPLQTNRTPQTTARDESETVSSNRYSISKTRRGKPHDERSGRHGNGGGQRYRTSSRSSLDSQRSHQNSRHRNNNNSRHSSNSSHAYKSALNHVSSTLTSEAEPLNSVACTQVAFIDTVAPLAEGESGSVDISIDLDTDGDDTKY